MASITTGEEGAEFSSMERGPRETTTAVDKYAERVLEEVGHATDVVHAMDILDVCS